MSIASALARGRESFERQAWGDAHAGLSAEDGERALGPDDLVMLATAAQMIGADTDAASAWTRAHGAYLAREDTLRAARCAYWITMAAIFRGDRAQASGWIARATRLLESVDGESVEHGFLLCAIAMRSIRAGEFSEVEANFTKACAIGGRMRDEDLIAQARHGVSNIFGKLGLSSRAAATAYAYEHRILSSTT